MKTYISLDAMIPQETEQTHIEYGFPVVFYEPCHTMRI